VQARTWDDLYFLDKGVHRNGDPILAPASEPGGLVHDDPIADDIRNLHVHMCHQATQCCEGLPGQRLHGHRIQSLRKFGAKPRGPVPGTVSNGIHRGVYIFHLLAAPERSQRHISHGTQLVVLRTDLFLHVRSSLPSEGPDQVLPVPPAGEFRYCDRDNLNFRVRGH